MYREYMLILHNSIGKDIYILLDNKFDRLRRYTLPIADYIVNRVLWIKDLADKVLVG